ncbi:MAG: DcrB-related protein [Anaerolineae bacterium]|nr:DcrB-related protein [Anaerolineae bacterium]
MSQFVTFYGPGFTIDAPSDWLVASSPQYQAAFMGPDGQPIRPNLIIAINAVEPDVTVPKLASETRERQQSEYPAYEILNEQSNDDESAFIRKFRWINPDNERPVVQTQMYLIDNNMLYSLTGSRSDELNHSTVNDLDDTLNHMFGSFSVT